MAVLSLRSLAREPVALSRLVNLTLSRRRVFPFAYSLMIPFLPDAVKGEQVTISLRLCYETPTLREIFTPNAYGCEAFPDFLWVLVP